MEHKIFNSLMIFFLSPGDAGQEGLGCDVEESRSVDVRGRPVALVLKVALGAFLPKGHTPLAGAGLDSVRVEVLFECKWL